MDSFDALRARALERAKTFEALADDTCLRDAAALAQAMIDCLASGGKVLFFGNGGSSMDAGHLAAELLGRYKIERASLPAVCLSDATAAITAIGNDYGYDEVFSRQVAGLGQAGDLAIGLTTSGNSANVVKALEVARERGVRSAAITGERGGRVHEVADICICVPSTDTATIQELTIHLGHGVIQHVEEVISAGAEETGGAAGQ